MYSTLDDVKFYSRLGEDNLNTAGLGMDYRASVMRAVRDADARIDSFCYPLREDGEFLFGFFEPGGAAVSAELLDGADVVYRDSTSRYVPGWYTGGESLLKFRYSPVLSVMSLEEETSAGTWTTRTEGRGSDYIVVNDGVRFMQNVPEPSYRNVRVTYKAGYRATPQVVQEVSAKLASALLHQLVDSGFRRDGTVGQATVTNPKVRLSDSAFTDEFKEMLKPYRKTEYLLFNG